MKRLEWNDFGITGPHLKINQSKTKLWWLFGLDKSKMHFCLYQLLEKLHILLLLLLLLLPSKAKMTSIWFVRRTNLLQGKENGLSSLTFCVLFAFPQAPYRIAVNCSMAGLSLLEAVFFYDVWNWYFYTNAFKFQTFVSIILNAQG